MNASQSQANPGPAPSLRDQVLELGRRVLGAGFADYADFTTMTHMLGVRAFTEGWSDGPEVRIIRRALRLLRDPGEVTAAEPGIPTAAPVGFSGLPRIVPGQYRNGYGKLTDPCRVCRRRIWDGGHALNPDECADQGGELCREIARGNRAEAALAALAPPIAALRASVNKFRDGRRRADAPAGESTDPVGEFTSACGTMAEARAERHAAIKALLEVEAEYLCPIPPTPEAP